MMRHYLALSAIVVLSCCFNALGQAGSDEASVRETVNHYLHGLKFNDVESLKKAFHPDAKLIFVKRDGQLGTLSQEQWYKGFASSAGQEEKGDLQIASVDITGGAASVKVVEVYDKTKYTDYLSLLKFDGRWQIVNKIYVVERR
ncbi:MAG: hypothetical protein C5B55_10265 [Blastocatellia bacterium]|nr:MAG: hypothetical protein C5B55_10265 [Blastocatellia bacterium]